MPDFGLIYLTHAAWFWVAIAAALLAVEVALGTEWLLWAAASAGVVAVVEALFDLPMALTVVLFAVLVIVSTLTARRWFPRNLADEGHDINDNIGRLMGREGRVAAAFDQGQGRVFIDGKEWSADLESGDTLEVGARVKVVGVSGARLQVREA